MAGEITIEVGILPPPACFGTGPAQEQARLEAFVAALTLTLQSNDEWQVSQLPPIAGNEHLNWLKLDASLRPVMAYSYVVADAAWVPWFSFPIFAVSSGAAGAYSLTNSPAFTTTGEAYVIGKTYVFKANHTSTGASTLNIDGLGPKAIKIKTNQPTVANTILQDQIVEVVYDGTNFQMVSAAGVLAITLADFIAGTDGQFLRTRDVATVPTTQWETSLYFTPAGSEVAIPATGDAVTFPHGLGGTPKLWGFILVCDDAGGDVGFSDGDEIQTAGVQQKSFDLADDSTPTVWADSTEIGYVTPASQLSEILLFHKTTGVRAQIVPAKWKLKAWAFK